MYRTIRVNMFFLLMLLTISGLPGLSSLAKAAEPDVEGVDAGDRDERLKAAEQIRKERIETIKQLLKIAASDPDKPLEKDDPRMYAISLLGEYRADSEDVLEFLIKHVDMAPPKVKEPKPSQYPCVEALIKIGKPGSQRAAIRLAQVQAKADDAVLKMELLIYVINQVEGEEIGEIIIEKTAPTVGGDPETIRFLFQRAADRRLQLMKSGKGERVYAIGFGGLKDAMPDLAVEYVRAKQVAQLSYAEVDSDLAAVAGFVSGGEGKRELLVLDGKPSAKALEVHGKKWNALGPDGTGPTEYIMAGRAVAIVVNPTNKLDSLTLGQVQAIFRGDTNNWTTVGNTGLDAAAGDKKSDLRINLFGLRPNDAVTAVFEKECLPRNKWKGVTSKKDTAEVLKAVSLDPLAIGFVDLGAVQASGQNAKILAIQVGTETIKPTAENIKNAMYPLSQRLYLYIHPNASETAKDFAKFLATCGGLDAGPYVDTVKAMMDTYGKHGLMPLGDAALERQAKEALAEAEKKTEKENKK